MQELALTALIVALILGLGALVSLLSGLQLLTLSLSIVITGLVIGILFGVRYHLLLRAELARLGPLPGSWFVHPTQHHGKLDAAAQAQIRRPFLWGAAGFVLILLGCALASLTLLLRFR